MKRLPFILGIATGLIVLILIGPIAAAVVLLRSSSDAVGPGLAVQIFIAVLVLALCAVAGGAVWALTRLVQRLLRRRR
ncbi:MAG TPA: hypothetical protein VGB48_05550 [Allosphingosinicella sp.]